MTCMKRERKILLRETDVSGRVIHTVVEVKVTPIIMREFLEDIFTFEVHEDVNLNTAYEILSKS